MFGKSEPFKTGQGMADLLVQQWVEMGYAPAPWPEDRGGVQQFVDAATPKAMEQIGTMLANQAGPAIAMPRSVMDEMERGFRKRLAQLVSRSVT